MCAYQQFLQSLETHEKELQNMLGCEFFFLNGEKMDIS